MRNTDRRITTAFLLTALCCSISSFNQAFAKEESLLKGKVQRTDAPTRIRRPELPTLTAVDKTPTPKLHGSAKHSNLSGGLAENDFALKFQKASPLVDDTEYDAPESAGKQPLAGDVESNELIIAWEEWHKRVCASIFERWRVLGKVPGVADTSLRFTRDRHVEVVIKSIEIDPDVFRLTPHLANMTMDEIKEEFAAAVRNSVLPLNGSLTLDFPSKSRRKSVRFDPAFRGTTGAAGYDWKKNDYERVPQ